MYVTRLHTLIESKHLYSRQVLHHVRETGAGILIQALPTTHIILTYVLRSHLVCIDLCIVSSPEDTPYPHPLHINSISLRIYLHINARHLDASPRYPEAAMTMRAAQRPSHAF
jgi:hypothetical protein